MATWATSFWQPGAVFRTRREQPIASTAAAVADADPLALPGLPNDDVYLYCKRIDNSRLVRQAATQVQGELSAIGGAFVAALLVAAIMIAPGVKNVMDSYKLQDLKREQAQLRNDRRKLDVEEERLINAGQLNKFASDYKLAPPAPNQMIRLQPKNNHSFAMNEFKSR